MPKKVILSDIIDNIMLDADNPRDYLYGISRTLVIKHAKTVLRELNYAGMKYIKIQIAEITASGKVIVPDDFVDYFKVFYCVGNYLKPVFYNEAINPTQWQILDKNEANHILTNLGMRILAGNSGGYLTYGRSSASGSGNTLLNGKMCGNICSLRGYKYDPNQGAFLLDYVPEGVTHVAIEYISNPLLHENDPSKLEVHPFFEKVVEAKTYYNLIMSFRDVPANEKDRARRVAEIKYRDALHQKHAKPYEFYQYLMGWKHMLKTSYPCAGGQSIPDSGTGSSSSYKGVFTDFICQKYVPEKVKQTVIISVNVTPNTASKTVFVSFTTPLALGSDIVLTWSMDGMGGPVEMGRGTSKATKELPAPSEDSILNVEMYSVGGILGINEDENFIYVPQTNISVPGISTERRTNKITLTSKIGANTLTITAQAEYPVVSNLLISLDGGSDDERRIYLNAGGVLSEITGYYYVDGNPTVPVTIMPVADDQYDYVVEEVNDIYDFSSLTPIGWTASYEYVDGRTEGAVSLIIRFTEPTDRQIVFLIYDGDRSGRLMSYISIPAGTTDFLSDSETMLEDMPTGTITAYVRRLSNTLVEILDNSKVWDGENIYDSSGTAEIKTT